MFKIRDKILVTFLSVVIIPIIITGTFFGIYITKYLKRDKIVEFQQSTKSKSEKVVYFMRSIENDIVSLGNNVFLLNLIEAIKSNDTEQINRCKFEVGTLFRMFSESRGIYDQICYIDESGNEIARVNLKGERHSQIVTSEELQNKSHRYYFREAKKLKAGNIYVSQLDLNRESGVIEVPYKPVLRHATPVFDRKKQNRGILVLNVLADFVFKHILMDEDIKGTNSFLLDREGFYLLHSDITKQWGGSNDLDTGENLKNDFQQETASIILTGESGNKLVDNRFYTFTPIHFDPSDNERYWIFLESLPKSIIYSPIYTFYIILGVLALLLITGVVASTFVFSRKLTRPLNKLVKGVTTIAERDLDDIDNLDYHINITSNDEIAFLTFSFNKMVYKLGKAKKKLLDYALNLEKKVEHKTGEVFEKAKELKAVNKELEDFVYIVSHDLKEPLFAIGGYTSRLSRVYKDTFDGKFYFKRIKVNMERMSQKIDEIMEVMKVGRVTYNFRNNNSGAVVKDIVEMLEDKIKDNKINVIIQDNLPTILCDERKMKDVLSNLLTNAIKFMGNNNQRQIRIGCDKNGDYYNFYVEDTGIGIQEEYQKQIFKIFRRLGEIEVEGSGVGLAMVKKIVELHKGKIWVESPVKDGRGSRFYFAIPISRKLDSVSPELDNSYGCELKTVGG